MRALADDQRIHRFMRVYFTGGATAVLHGWRRPIKFIPVKDGWEDRSPFVGREGRVSFHHFDLYAQALSKIERGHAQDVDDVQEMLRRGLVEPGLLGAYFEAIAPRLYRYPALDPPAFRRAVDEVIGPSTRLCR